MKDKRPGPVKRIEQQYVDKFPPIISRDDAKWWLDLYNAALGVSLGAYSRVSKALADPDTPPPPPSDDASDAARFRWWSKRYMATSGDVDRGRWIVDKAMAEQDSSDD